MLILMRSEKFKQVLLLGKVIGNFIMELGVFVLTWEKISSKNIG